MKRIAGNLVLRLEDPPDSLEIFRNIRDLPYAFFLDSACGHERLGRYSFIGCDPFLVFKSKNDSIKLEWADGRIETFKSDPFCALEEIMRRFSAKRGTRDTPLASGGVGYFSYDLKDFIEDLPREAVDDISAPDCVMGFYESVFTYDNLKNRCFITGTALSSDDRTVYSNLVRLRDKAASPAMERPARRASRAHIRSNFTKASYMEAVRKAKGYIRKGDIYQVNLSQRFEADLNMDPLELYRRLRTMSPAPFSAYLDFKDVAVLSSSPERFLLRRGDYIETRPIKGTRPRSPDPSRDLALEGELRRSKKDMAEHIMIVDLERNDLGKICEYGSVKLAESAAMERYANVFHLVSTVSGTLRKGVGNIDCLRATFPGGSITGAPKIRSMEIIDSLEDVRRSVYTGAIGYLSFGGNMDTSIAIRTFLIKKDKVYFQVGGGIVADSDPEKEYEETLDKARGLMRSLGVENVSEEMVGHEYHGVG